MKDKIININDTIKSLIPTAKEAIKSFYGEKYESLIEERFKNLTVVGYITPKEIERRLNTLFNNKSNELIESFLRENNIEVNKENIKLYFSSYNLSTPNLQNINVIYNYQERDNNNEYETKNVLNLLRQMIGNDSIELNSNEYYDALNMVNELKPSYERILKEFNDYKDQYKEYSNYIDSCKKLEQRISNKYTKLFFEEIKEYLSDHDKDLIKKDNIIPYNLDCNRLLVNGEYRSKALIDSFTTKSDEQLKDDNVPDYIKQDIINDRINYFKRLGIDLGNNYEDYLNNELVKEKYPSKEIADKISNLRENLYSKQQEEYIGSTIQYKEQLSEIESLDILDKNHSYKPKEMLNHLTCINPHIKREGNNYTISPLLLFAASHAVENEFFDVILIHELNHLVELSTLKVDENKYEITCGYDIINGDLTNQEEDDDNREYELFNEIINELLAQEITRMMHNNGVYLLSNKETAKIGHGTSHEKNKVIIINFYETYKEEIIESRLTGNMEILYNKVGKENIERLNKLVNSFSKEFSEFKYFTVIRELNQKKDTENTRKFYEFIEERNTIMESMSTKRERSK